MEDKKSTTHLVVVGLWNKAIFSAEWVQKNILSGTDKIKVEVPIGLDSSLKFTTNDFSFVIAGSRLEMGSQTLIDSSFQSIIESSRKIFRLLPHTPVNALGINHVFQCKIEEFDFESFFSFKDTADLTSDLSDKMTNNTIQRKFEINEIETINLSISTSKEKACEFSFNFNYKLEKIEDLFGIIAENNDFIVDKRKHALSILESVYKLTM